MDSREAREILALYRPGSTDAADPRMAEALDQARRDPELAAWFEEHAAVNAAIRARFKAIPVPPGLKREIIIGRAEHTRIIPFPGAVKILAAAAAIAFLVAIGWYSFRKPTSPYTFLSYRYRVVRRVQKGVTYIDMSATNQADIFSYFQKHDGPANFVLPPKLQELPGEGGSVFPWNNQKVAMLCLNAGTAGTRNDLWLFVVDKSVLPDPPPGKPQYAMEGNLMTASWTEGGKVFILAGAGDPGDLQKYLSD